MAEDIVISNHAIQEGNRLLTADQVAAGFNRMVLDADYTRRQLADAGDWEKLAHGLQVFRNMKAQLDVLIRAIEDDCASHLPDKQVVVEGLGVIERRSTTSRKWDSENLLQHLVRMTLDPEFTGEVKYENVFNLVSVLKEVLPFTPSMAWRVTALRENNVPVDEFSETTYGRQTITIK